MKMLVLLLAVLLSQDAFASTRVRRPVSACGIRGCRIDTPRHPFRSIYGRPRRGGGGNSNQTGAAGGYTGPIGGGVHTGGTKD